MYRDCFVFIVSTHIVTATPHRDDDDDDDDDDDGVRGSPGTCEDDVGDVAVVTVAQLLGVLQAAAGESHHGGLGVVEGGALAEQAGRADGVLDHVELLQLGESGQVE